MTLPAIDVMDPASADRIGTDLATSTTALAARLADVAIVTQADADQAVRDRQLLNDQRKTVVDYFAPIKQMAYKLHRKICDRETAILQPLDARDRAISRGLVDWKAAADRIRQEEEQAEQQRRHQEQQAAALHEAAALEAGGETELAAAVMDDAIQTAPPVVALPDITRTVPGLKFRKVWKWKYSGGPAVVKDTPATVIARTMKLVPREFLTVDEIKIGAYVRSMKASGSIPGIDIYATDEPVR